MMERLSKKEFETWTMVVWSLWNARNRMHFRQSQPHHIEILKQAIDLMEEYQKLIKDLVHQQWT